MLYSNLQQTVHLFTMLQLIFCFFHWLTTWSKGCFPIGNILVLLFSYKQTLQSTFQQLSSVPNFNRIALLCELYVIKVLVVDSQHSTFSLDILGKLFVCSDQNPLYNILYSVTQWCRAVKQKLKEIQRLQEGNYIGNQLSITFLKVN